MKEYKVKGWVVKDDWHICPFLFMNKPIWDKSGWEYGCGEMWIDQEVFNMSEEGLPLPVDMFPELTKDTSPIAVELTIKAFQ